MDFERRLRILAMASTALLPAACGEGPAAEATGADADDDEIAAEQSALIEGVAGSCGGSCAGISADFDFGEAERPVGTPCLWSDAPERVVDGAGNARLILPCPPPPPDGVIARPQYRPGCLTAYGHLPCPPPDD